MPEILHRPVHEQSGPQRAAPRPHRKPPSLRLTQVELTPLLRHQDGVVSRAQVLASGLTDSDIARKVRRREWARLFAGVYVDHTGTPSWEQLAWGSTLLHAPAALDSWSALRASGLTLAAGHDDISLVVAAHRRVDDPPGVRTRRTRAWHRVTQLHLSPPRVRLETAALTAASEAKTEDAAVGLLADVVQQRRTTAERLRIALDESLRLSRRSLLADVLTDVTSGALSPLERRYLRDVERAHGLPHGHRQRRVRSGDRLQIRDVDYTAFGIDVELDGRLGHEMAQDRWEDLDRDLRSLVSGTITVRAGWGQVLKPCRLAAVVAAVLNARGWSGRPLRCGAECELS